MDDLKGLIVAGALPIVRTQEEKDSFKNWCTRAKRMYQVYKRQEEDSDCLSFPEYAVGFHGIPEDIATEYWQTGEIQ